MDNASFHPKKKLGNLYVHPRVSARGKEKEKVVATRGDFTESGGKGLLRNSKAADNDPQSPGRTAKKP
jgi:hypothetical protein